MLNSTVPLYEKLKEQLLEHIEKNAPRLLPGENELVAHYGVSRTTVRRALRDLSDAGVIRPVQGLGTLVLKRRKNHSDRFILLLVAKNWGMFAQDIFSRLVDTLSHFQLSAILCMVDLTNPDEERLRYLLEKSEGVVVDPWVSRSESVHAVIQKYNARPVALRWISPFPEDSFVTEDVPGGYYLLTRHLLDLGHRDIALLCNQTDGLHMPGILRAFREAGLEPDPTLIIHENDWDRKTGYHAAARLLESGRFFSAVIAHNDISALGIMEKLHQAGLRIPQDISLVGSDNIADSEDYPVPLTTFGGDHQRMVNETIAILLREHNAAVRTTFPPQLIIRQSTAPFSGENRKPHPASSHHHMHS